MAQPSSRDFGAEIGGGEEMEQVERKMSTMRPKVKVNFAKAFQDPETRDQPPELFLMENMAMRPRAMSHHVQSTKIPSRAWLKVKARFWRSLMTFGMTFHDFAPPKPPKPSFVRSIATDTIPIELYFYVPKIYEQRKKDGPDHQFPLVVNFHGGGFCLGHATDDRYWAAVILKSTSAVFVSVNYRRAPEHPFPQPIDDCVEALLYLQSHAEELHIDITQTALSGFSAGANLAFTVPFRLTYQYEKQPSVDDLALATPERTTTENFVPEPPKEDPDLEQAQPTFRLNSEDRTEAEMGLLTPLPLPNNNNNQDTPTTKQSSPWSSATDLSKTTTNNNPTSSRTNLLNLPGPRSRLIRTITNDSYRAHGGGSTTSLPRAARPPPSALSNTPTRSRSPSPDPAPRLRIVSILAWYPLLDWTSSRSEKKRSSRNPKKTLPALFTDLFDFSYLPAPDHAGHHCSPYASPSLASNHMITDGLPQRIQMWLCEWDMLLHEGERFAERLQELGKDVKVEMIQGVPHGWDKSPNPFRDQKRIDGLYERAAGYLRHVFGEAERRATVGEGIGLGGLR